MIDVNEKQILNTPKKQLTRRSVCHESATAKQKSEKRSIKHKTKQRQRKRERDKKIYLYKISRFVLVV